MLYKTRARNARPYGYGGTISRYFFPQHCRGAHCAPVIWNLCKISDLLIYCLCFYCNTIVWKLQMGTDSLGGELLQSRCARQTFGVPLACFPHSGRQAPRPRRGSLSGRFTISCKTARFAFKFPLSMLAPCYSTYITNFFNTSSNPLHDLPLRGTFSIVAASGGFRR